MTFTAIGYSRQKEEQWMKMTDVKLLSSTDPELHFNIFTMATSTRPYLRRMGEHVDHYLKPDNKVTILSLTSWSAELISMIYLISIRQERIRQETYFLDVH